jgi:hypothetical protein
LTGRSHLRDDFHREAVVAHRFNRCTSLVLLGGLASAGCLSAQQIWLGSGRGGEFSVEILRPDLKSIAGDQSFASVAAFVTGRFPLGPKTTLVAELPFAHGSFTYSYFGGGATESGSGLGNPYIGAEGGRDGSVAARSGGSPPRTTS